MEFEFARNKQASKQANVPLSHMWIWMAQQELEVTMTLKTGLEQQGQTILNYFLTSHILLFLTVFGFFSFFVSYLSSFSSFFFSYIMYSYTPYLDILF